MDLTPVDRMVSFYPSPPEDKKSRVLGAIKIKKIKINTSNQTKRNKAFEEEKIHLLV